MLAREVRRRRDIVFEGLGRTGRLQRDQTDCADHEADGELAQKTGFQDATHKPAFKIPNAAIAPAGAHKLTTPTD